MGDAPGSSLRSLLARSLLAGGVGLVALSLALSSDAGSTSAATKILAWSIGATVLITGLWIFAFGTLKVLGLIKIDLRGGRTQFVVGAPFCNVRLTDGWRSGAFRLSARHDVFLVVPWLARLVATLVLGYLVQQLLAKWTGTWWALGFALVLGVLLWGLQARIPGAEPPAPAA